MSTDLYYLQVAQIALFVLMGFLLPAVGMILLAFVLQKFFGYLSPNPIKTQPYECGMKPVQEAHVQFDIRYYLYALLFLIFDIEIVFIIPWALATDYLSNSVVKDGAWLGVSEIVVFILILGFGLAYAWRRGALEWE